MSRPPDTEIIMPANPDLDDLGVQGFLDALGVALTSGDTPSLIEMWDTPAFVLSDDLDQAITDPDELRNMFAGAREQYNARGVTGTRAEIVRLDEITDRIVSVRVRWPWLNEDGEEIGAEVSTYTLRRDEDGDWKLRITIMHGMEAVN